MGRSETYFGDCKSPYSRPADCKSAGTGDLINTYLYSSDGGNTFAQKLKYHYNIRGWLKSLNDFENPGFDLFAMRLAYERPNVNLAVAARYNGNVSQMCSNGRYSTAFGFGFNYDKFNRLYGVNYAEGTNLQQNYDAYTEDYSYDENGNLQSLWRAYNGDYIDELYYYYYEGTNRIERISDIGETIGGYNAYLHPYNYDNNGNSTYIPSRHASVVYSRLNKPLTVSFSPTDKIHYFYSSTGTKLRKQVTAMATPQNLTTDYCGEFMYEDNELVCIFAPFGRMRPMETDQGTQWRTYYSLTDHLGNVRAEFVAHDSGQPELVQQTDYYPFGYTLRRNDFGSQQPNRRLFGGKELQDETLAGNTLDWYDFEARMYDPLIGRFMTTDPLAEKYYGITPYGYCGNNPMNLIDPTGTSISEFDEEGNYIQTIKDNWWHNFWHGRTGRIVDSEGNYIFSFEFADPYNDVKDLKSGSLTKIQFVNEEDIVNILDKAGVFDKENKIKNRDSRYGFIKEEGKGDGKLDFAMKSENGLGTFYGSETYSSLYLVDGVAHNAKNYGNFLFGAAGRALGLTQFELLLGAHYNSLFNPKENGYRPQFDSSDDQYSIRLGIRHANNYNYDIKTTPSPSYKIIVEPLQYKGIY